MMGVQKEWYVSQKRKVRAVVLNQGKVPTQLASPVPGQALWPVVSRNIEHFAKFLDLFETQCWQL